jgi:hypothetical protein
MRHELKVAGMQREGRGGERRLHDRLAYVVRVDNRAVVAVLAAAADAVLVAHQAYPATIAGNPKA